MCAGSCDPVTTEFVPIDENVAQVIVQAELEREVTGICNRPAVLIMVIHQKAMRDGAVPESPVVICSTSAAILNTIHKIMIMNHFVQQSGDYLFNRPCQSSRTNIDLMRLAILADPCVIAEREVAEGLGGGLDGDGGS